MSKYRPVEARSRLAARVAAIVGIGVVLLILWGCGGGGSLGGSTQSDPPSTPPPPPTADLLSLQVTPNQATVSLGEAQQFKAMGSLSDGTSKDMSSSVTWASSSTTVAEVSNLGLATGRHTGTVAITAASGTVKSSATLTVTTSLIGVSVTPPKAVLTVGTNQQFTATGSYDDGSYRDVSASVTWSSDTPSVASVTASGLASAKASGVATMRATVGGFTGSATVTVTQATLVALALSPQVASIATGQTQAFIATGTYSDGSTQDFTAAATWTSSVPAIASINSVGVATGLSPGSDTISAATGGRSASSGLTVTPGVLVSISVSPADSAVPLGKTQQFSATGTYSDGSTQDLTSSVTWSSGSPTVATITTTGIATALADGTAGINAQSGTLNGAATLTVLPSLALDYFANANSNLLYDGAVRINNPGESGGDLCAMIYVFDQDQQMTECCGCQVTPDGLRTLSLATDLTANPLTGVPSTTGVIKVVPADAASNPSCNPSVLTPSSILRAWGTHVQVPRDATVEITETELQDSLLSASEQTNLPQQCGFIQTQGSGHGICTCGTGD